jgi:hypothetical protein
VIRGKVVSVPLDEAVSGTLENHEMDIRCFDDLAFGQRISAPWTIRNGVFGKDVPFIDLREL